MLSVKYLMLLLTFEAKYSMLFQTLESRNFSMLPVKYSKLLPTFESRIFKVSNAELHTNTIRPKLTWATMK